MSLYQVPIGPQPSLIAPIGVKIYDEIGQAMVGNPLNPPDPGLVCGLTQVLSRQTLDLCYSLAEETNKSDNTSKLSL
jgi:hypothetical protein